MSGTVSVVGLTGVAAAADILPGHTQTIVTQVINDYTPFTLDPARPPAMTPANTPTMVSPATSADLGSGVVPPPPESHPSAPQPSRRESPETTDNTPTSSPTRTRSPEPNDSPSGDPTGGRTPRPSSTGSDD